MARIDGLSRIVAGWVAYESGGVGPAAAASGTLLWLWYTTSRMVALARQLIYNHKHPTLAMMLGLGGKVAFICYIFSIATCVTNALPESAS